MALLGEAFVKIRPDTDGFEKEASSKIGGGLKKVAGLVTSAFAGIKVGGFLKDSITEASDFGETVSKSANVFGAKLAPAIQAFAATAPKAFGLSESAALGATAQFGNMFQQLGFTGDAAAKASTNLIKTAADLGSFNNVDPSDVLDRIGASLRGEFDSLQQLIPNINATRVANEALAATGKKSAADLTAQEKATATLAIIQKDGALAADDFAETSGGLANQQRILAATVDTLQRRLGEKLLPVATKVVTFLAANAEPAFDRVSAATKGFFDALKGTGPLDDFVAGGTSAGRAGLLIRDNFAKLKPVITEFIAGIRSGKTEVPSFTGLLDVGSAALKLVADNADLVVKALPFLIAGYVAVKTAQAAGNVVALASLPIQAATVVSNIVAARANRALATAIASQTAIQNANAVATGRGTIATVANATATAARTVVTKAATLATKVFTAAQFALNLVLRANPIGLVITALSLLVAGIVLAYRNSETFRSVVITVFKAVSGAVLTAIDSILFVFEKLFGVLGRLPGKAGEAFRSAETTAKAARAGVDALKASIDKIESKSVTITLTTREIDAADSAVAAQDNAGAGDRQRRRRGLPARAGLSLVPAANQAPLLIPGQRSGLQRGGLVIENLNVTSGPGEKASESVPRALRNLAFTMGV